jgi:hypothetical protein
VTGAKTVEKSGIFELAELVYEQCTGREEESVMRTEGVSLSLRFSKEISGCKPQRKVTFVWLANFKGVREGDIQYFSTLCSAC